MEQWAQYYLSMGFPVMPLAKGTKVPVAKGWDTRSFNAREFRGRNIGTRVGEEVTINAQAGNFFVLDFDSPNLPALKQLCQEYALPRTTCVRTGGNHNGYHLMYLTDFPISKHSGLSYRGCPIDFMGAKSYVVMPPSTVDTPYRYRIPLEEIVPLNQETYELMLRDLRKWQQVTRTARKATEAKQDLNDTLAQLRDTEGVSEVMLEYVKSTEV